MEPWSALVFSFYTGEREAGQDPVGCLDCGTGVLCR